MRLEEFYSALADDGCFAAGLRMLSRMNWACEILDLTSVKNAWFGNWCTSRHKTERQVSMSSELRLDRDVSASITCLHYFASIKRLNKLFRSVRL